MGNTYRVLGHIGGLHQPVATSWLEEAGPSLVASLRVECEVAWAGYRLSEAWPRPALLQHRDRAALPGEKGGKAKPGDAGGSWCG